MNSAEKRAPVRLLERLKQGQDDSYYDLQGRPVRRDGVMNIGPIITLAVDRYRDLEEQIRRQAPPFANAYVRSEINYNTFFERTNPGKGSSFVGTVTSVATYAVQFMARGSKKQLSMIRVQ